MKKFFSITLLGSMLMTSTAFAQDAAFSQKPFTDVPTTSKYYEAIEYLRVHNVLKGYIDGTFKADTRINRAEFLKFIVNPLLLDTNNLSACIGSNLPKNATTVYFPDVASDSWYAPETCFAKTKNLIDGYPDGMFRPNNSINFVEAAKILSNVFSLEVTAPDVGASWYIPYVKRLSDLHAIPTSIKRFGQTLTRGEMAEIVYRLKADRTNKASATFSAIR